MSTLTIYVVSFLVAALFAGLYYLVLRNLLLWSSLAASSLILWATYTVYGSFGLAVLFCGLVGVFILLCGIAEICHRYVKKQKLDREYKEAVIKLSKK